MANYDRRILVPYLQDVCSAELICAKLERELNQCDHKIGNLNRAINCRYTMPNKPNEDNYEPDYGTLAPVFIGVFIALIGGLIWAFVPWIYVIGIFGVIYGVIMMLVGISETVDSVSRANERYKEDFSRYENAVAAINAKQALIPSQKNDLINCQRQRNVLQNRLQNARKLMDDVYGVNIIAKKYRNIYVAYYLYDYFSTSRETDLDKIIQTLLLDEIKQRLDKVIVQNEQILLNQRVQIAMQEQQNRAMAENHREQMRGIARMESNQELQMDYQNMIAKNQAVTNFILAADYIQKYR